MLWLYFLLLPTIDATKFSLFVFNFFTFLKEINHEQSYDISSFEKKKKKKKKKRRRRRRSDFFFSIFIKQTRISPFYTKEISPYNHICLPLPPLTPLKACESAPDAQMIEKMIDSWNVTDQEGRGATSNNNSFFNCPGMNSSIQEHKCAPIHVAARCDRPDVLRVLFDKGADVNQRDSQGYLAIHVALLQEADRCIVVLMEEHRKQYYRDLVSAKKKETSDKEEEDQQTLILEQVAADRQLISQLSEASEKQYLKYKTAAASDNFSDRNDGYCALQEASLKWSREIDRQIDLGMHLRKWYLEQPEKKRPQNVPSSDFDLFLYGLLQHFVFLTKEGKEEEAKREKSFKDDDSTTTFTFQKPKNVFEKPSSSSSISLTLTKKEWKDFASNNAEDLKSCMVTFSLRVFPIPPAKK